jgi:hypothetical protein
LSSSSRSFPSKLPQYLFSAVQKKVLELRGIQRGAYSRWTDQKALGI